MIFSKSLMANAVAGGFKSNFEAQFEEVKKLRDNANRQEKMFVRNGQMAANDGVIPRDVYRDFDNVTVERMRSDDGDTFLNDLMPLTRSVNIGKLIQEYRQASDAGRAQTSMSGQQGVKLDQVEFSIDGSIIPITDAGFSRNWRESNAQKSEGFDALIDDQRETVATIRRSLADQFLDGHKDADGNFIVIDARQWQGMRNDARVSQVDLGVGGVNFDFTLTTNTGDQIKAAFIQVRDVLWITNKCEQDATYYVSREIASNFERKFSTQYDAKIIMQELADLMGVATIKTSSKLSGNEFMAFTLDGKIRPVSGMAVNTVAMPRPLYNSNFEFTVWTALGWQVRDDFFSNSCALFAQDLT